MANDYREDPEIAQFVQDIIKNPAYELMRPLVKFNVRVLVAVCERCNKEGETQTAKTDQVKLTRLGGAEKLFIEDGAHYILTVDWGAWQNSSPKRRGALVLNALSTIDVEGDETEGDIKLKKRKPNIVTFRQTATAFGATTDDEQDLKESWQSTVDSASRKQAEKDFPKAAAKPEPAKPKAAPKPQPEPEPEPESGPEPAVEEEVPAPTAPEDAAPEEAPAMPRRITPKGFKTRPGKTSQPAPPDDDPEPAPTSEDDEPPRVRAVPVPLRRTTQQRANKE
jgi:hypothetical protein